MRWHRIPSFVALLLLVQANPGQGAAARQAVGVVTRVQAAAEAVYESEARGLAERSPVLFDDLLQTGAAARLQATLADGTEITLGEMAEILIDAFVYDPESGDGVLELRVVEGAFLFVGGKLEELAGARVEIATPVAILGVRGTTVWGGPIDGGYGVLVLDGTVTVTTSAGAVNLGAGEATMIAGPGQAPDPAQGWSSEKTARAVATISFDDD